MSQKLGQREGCPVDLLLSWSVGMVLIGGRLWWCSRVWSLAVGGDSRLEGVE